VFARVFKAKDIYRGAHVASAPDVVLGYHAGFRASWETVLGTYAADVVADNTDPWSGDHCMYSGDLRGVLLSNRPIASDAPAMTDLAPTILAEYGVPAPEGTEGSALLARG
jgi:predicted AlkP superfamily phosphohydrolase/phosphomutase